MRKIVWNEIAQEGLAVHMALVTRSTESSWDLHTHDFHEVFWVDAGACEHLLNDCVERLDAGSLVFVRDRDTHGFRALPGSEAFAMINLAFPVPAWRALRDRYGLGAFWDEHSPHPPTLRLDGPLARDIRARFLDILHAPPDALHRDAFLLGLATHLRPPPELPGFDTLPAWLRTALLAYNLDPTRLEEGPSELARRCGCSSAHLCRVLGERLRTRPSDYIRQARIRHAARLLECSSASITDIALAAGFGNLSHFHRCFRETHQLSPAKYRQQHQRSIL